MKIINSHSETVVCPPEEELEVIRHSAAHIMAQAIQHLWPEADFAFGPATDKGFYYDVDLGETKLTDEDLQRIEDEMRKIVKEKTTKQMKKHRKSLKILNLVLSHQIKKRLMTKLKMIQHLMLKKTN
jgi:threonyl-tRNA synthetase